MIKKSAAQKHKAGNNAERIVEAIRERVYKWEYPPNHPLGEELLSQEFGVSRSPVREALRCLETEGVVRRIPNRGYFVRQYKTDEISELYIVRLALELFVAEQLALNPVSHAGVKALAEPWLQAMNNPDDPDDPAGLARIDEAFHEKLAELTGNAMLLNHLKGINARLFVFRAMDFTFVKEHDTLKESCESHLQVIDAIASGDPAAARAAIRANLEMGLGNVDKSMGRILAKTFNS